MKARRLVELRSLLSSAAFQSWWGQLQKARRDAEAARLRYDELLSQTTLMEFRAELTQKNAIDTLYRAGELEDQAATLAVQAQELENRSLLAVSDFEEQRYKVSELWYRLGAAEKTLDECRGQPQKEKASERAFRLLADEYERESARRDGLWDDVEGIWTKAAEANLLVSEHRVRGRKIRKEAEQLFALAEERKLRARELKDEADKASAAWDEQDKAARALLEEAHEHFGCTSGTEFLFFRVKDNQKLAYAVALVEDRDNFNLEVMPLAIYTVDRQRGVAFLEPARFELPSAEDGDRRFEQYFLSGRKGEVRTVAR